MMICASRAPRARSAAFSLVEVIVAISLVGIGLSTIIATLTKLNTFANNARNATGAYAAVMNQIDQFQSLSPFNPQNNEIPTDTGSFPKYDLTTGTHKISTNGTDFNVPVYQYNDPNTGTTIVVKGALTITVTDDSTNYKVGSVKIPINRYKATVTVKYTYLNRSYSLSMDTVRASDE